MQESNQSNQNQTHLFQTISNLLLLKFGTITTRMTVVEE